MLGTMAVLLSLVGAAGGPGGGVEPMKVKEICKDAGCALKKTEIHYVTECGPGWAWVDFDCTDYYMGICRYATVNNWECGTSQAHPDFGWLI